MKLHRSTVAAIAIALLMLLTACGEQELYTGLTQRQANEMTAVLRNAGIGAVSAS